MRLIPGRTKVKVELFKGVSIADMVIGAVFALLIVFVLTSSLPGKLYIAIGLLILAVALLARMDAEPNYLYLLHILRHFGYRRNFSRLYSDEMLLRSSEAGEKEAVFEALFQQEKKHRETETKAEQKARLKAEKAERKADDKILKDKRVSKEEKDAIWLKRANQSAAKKKEKAEQKRDAKNSSVFDMAEIIAFTDIKDDLIHYGGKYYGAVLEIPPVEFRFFSPLRRTTSIENGVGQILRALPMDYAANIVKIERPLIFDSFIENEYSKLEELRTCYEQGMLTEEGAHP